MKARVKVLVVEDQGMFRAFLVEWLSGLSGYELVGAAPSAEDALVLVTEKQPDLLVVDLQLPGMDGLEFVRAARQLRPQARALVLSSLVDPLALTRVRESGVEGYLEKDAPPVQLQAALDAVAAGRRSHSTRYQEVMSREGGRPLAIGKILSRREQQVLSQVLEGRTSREIAERIGLSARTVEFHRANIMGKLGAANVTELVVNARLHGFTGMTGNP
ncbi:response regulator transcription factor [Luteolibacter ambystomatis]|uniref:Response regulator transcription factor n=1 Tax=Luteolibacter ambystomatis TaxID=2824561 RepID=A0A975PGS1_9BACT|nr:response regulator transcription factor [Luteolibacter ambystomatis]QUE53019.1 response regulator transcription factor [Luteolibacter ambystomatis]